MSTPPAVRRTTHSHRHHRHYPHDASPRFSSSAAPEKNGPTTVTLNASSPSTSPRVFLFDRSLAANRKFYAKKEEEEEETKEKSTHHVARMHRQRRKKTSSRHRTRERTEDESDTKCLVHAQTERTRPSLILTSEERVSLPLQENSPFPLPPRHTARQHSHSSRHHHAHHHSHHHSSPTRVIVSPFHSVHSISGRFSPQQQPEPETLHAPLQSHLRLSSASSSLPYASPSPAGTSSSRSPLTAPSMATHSPSVPFGGEKKSTVSVWRTHQPTLVSPLIGSSSSSSSFSAPSSASTHGTALSSPQAVPRPPSSEGMDTTPATRSRSIPAPPSLVETLLGPTATVGRDTPHTTGPSTFSSSPHTSTVVPSSSMDCTTPYSTDRSNSFSSSSSSASTHPSSSKLVERGGSGGVGGAAAFTDPTSIAAEAMAAPRIRKDLRGDGEGALASRHRHRRPYPSTEAGEPSHGEHHHHHKDTKRHTERTKESASVSSSVLPSTSGRHHHHHHHHHRHPTTPPPPEMQHTSIPHRHRHHHRHHHHHHRPTPSRPLTVPAQTARFTEDIHSSSQTTGEEKRDTHDTPSATESYAWTPPVVPTIPSGRQLTSTTLESFSVPVLSAKSAFVHPPLSRCVVESPKGRHKALHLVEHSQPSYRSIPVGQSQYQDRTRKHITFLTTTTATHTAVVGPMGGSGGCVASTSTSPVTAIHGKEVQIRKEEQHKKTVLDRLATNVRKTLFTIEGVDVEVAEKAGRYTTEKKARLTKREVQKRKK